MAKLYKDEWIKFYSLSDPDLGNWKEKSYSPSIATTASNTEKLMHSMGVKLTSFEDEFAKLHSPLGSTPAQNASELDDLSYQLPGIDVEVEYPCNGEEACSPLGKAPLRYVIMHLNDIDKWTREQIADWLTVIDDPYGDGPDLAFKPTQERK